MLSIFSFHSSKHISIEILTLILAAFIGLPGAAFPREQPGGNLHEAVARAEQAAHENPSAETYLTLGLAYLEVASTQKAQIAFSKAVKLAPQYPAGYCWLGEVYFLQGRYEDSMDLFQRALEVFPDWSVAHISLGISHYKRHNHEEAEAAFMTALKLMLSPGSPRYRCNVPEDFFVERNKKLKTRMESLSLAHVHYHLGLIEAKRGHPDKATAYWQHAIEIGPSLTQAHFELGVAYIKIKQWEQAEHALREVIHLEPEMPGAHYQLAQLFFKQGKRAEAAEAMKTFQRLRVAYAQLAVRHTVLTQAPDAATTLFGLAEEYLNAEMYDEAILELQKALWHDPNLAVAYNGLGYAYTMQGRFEEALKVQQQAVALKPQMAEAHLGLGIIWLKVAAISQNEADYGRALTSCRTAIELNPDLPAPTRVHVALGRGYMREGKLSQASRQYQDVLKADPNDVDTHYQLANIYAEQNRFNDGEEAYHRVISLAPSSAKAYERLALLYDVQSIHADKALKLAQKAVELQPDSAAYWNTLSWLHYQNEDYMKAETAIKKALTVQPNNPLYYEDLKTIEQAKQAKGQSEKVGKRIRRSKD